MRTDEIRFVTEVYRTGSMARAARNLNITPQGLGKAIQKLEKELGINVSRDDIIRAEKRFFRLIKRYYLLKGVK